MKIILVLVMAALLAGCSQKPDPGAAALEARITSLEKSIEEINQHLNRQSNYMVGLYGIQTNMANAFSTVTNFDPVARLAEAFGTNNDTRLDIADMRLAALEDQFSNLSLIINRRAGNPPAPAIQNDSSPMPAFIEGITADTYRKIATDAADKYPNDYNLQVYVIKEQVAAYKTLHGSQ